MAISDNKNKDISRHCMVNCKISGKFCEKKEIIRLHDLGRFY